MEKTIKAIPTIYNDISFRSKLEASWAKYFDSIDMNWQYEVEGYEFIDGARYLPDFWMPECRTFFEVKGPLHEKDMNKMRRLAEAVAPKGIMVAIGSADIPDSLGLVYPIPFPYTDEYEIENGHGILYNQDYVDIAICNRCKKPYIIFKYQGWTCRNCGFYDGDNTWERLLLYEKH